MSNLKEHFCLIVISLSDIDASFDSKEIGDDNIFIPFMAYNKGVIQVSLERGILALFDDKKDSAVVDKY